MHSVYLAVGSYRAETNPELPLSRWPLSRAVTVMLNEQLRMQLPSGVQLRQHVHANRNSTTLATNSTLSRYSGSAALCRQIHSETEDTTTTEIYLALNDRLWFGTTLAIAAQLYAYW
jgi:ligand-binding sensor domain-containing protein